MEHSVEIPCPPFTARGGRLWAHMIPAWQDNLIWLLVDGETKEAAAVDGPCADPVLEYCKRHGFELTTIFNTHTHGDHIGINKELEKQGVVSSLRVVGAESRADEIPGISQPVRDGSTVEFAGSVGTVLLTEGHIDGHVSYVFEDFLLCGDTLFAGGCGYLFDGPPKKMYESLRRFAGLDPETKVLCAHEYTEDNLLFAAFVEPENLDLLRRIDEVKAVRQRGESAVPSTIGEELLTNPFLRQSSPSLVERLREEFPGRDLEAPAEIFAATRELKDRKTYKS